MNNVNRKKLFFKNNITFYFFWIFIILGFLVEASFFDGISIEHHEDIIARQDSHKADDVKSVAGSIQPTSASEDAGPTPRE